MATPEHERDYLNDERLRDENRARSLEALLVVNAMTALLGCPECSGRRWVWEFVGDDAMKAPCPRCRVIAAPSETEMDAMQRTRRAGEGHAA